MKIKKYSKLLIVSVVVIMMLSVFGLVACGGDETITDTTSQDTPKPPEKPDSPITTINDMFEYAPKTCYDLILSKVSVPEGTDIIVNLDHDSDSTIKGFTVRYFTQNDKSATRFVYTQKKDMQVKKFLVKKEGFEGMTSSSGDKLTVALDKVTTYSKLVKEFVKYKNITSSEIIFSMANAKPSTVEKYTTFVTQIHTENAIYKATFDLPNADTEQGYIDHLNAGKVANITVKETYLGTLLDANAQDKEYPVKK